MGWIMGIPKQTNIIALIRRYVPGKSFIVISPEKDKNNAYISIAKTTGVTKATIIDLNTVEKLLQLTLYFVLVYSLEILILSRYLKTTFDNKSDSHF